MNIGFLIGQNDKQQKHGKLCNLVWQLKLIWEKEGHDITIYHGPHRNAYNEDLLFVHIDQTYVSSNIAKFAQKHPNAINAFITDISKKTISSNLLDKNSKYNGPVIVKSNLNYAGKSESNLMHRMRRLIVKLKPFNHWDFVHKHLSFEYEIYKHFKEIPLLVRWNPNLVIEKFIPEREGELFCLRFLFCFGDNYWNYKVFSNEPIIKSRHIIKSEIAEIPPELIKIVKRLKLDYGKVDYVMHNGQVNIIDVNKTPGALILRILNVEDKIAEKMARGIDNYLPN